MARLELNQVAGAIRCELTAARMASDKLAGWSSKSSLYITTVGRVQADAGILLLASSITPNLLVRGKDTRISFSEFVVKPESSNPDADRCDSVNDPSQTGLGLAAWLLGNINADGIQTSGLSYTKEAEVEINPSARFGFSFIPNTGVANLTLNGIGTHRLVVAMAPPPPRPVKPKPVEVIIVGDRRIVVDSKPSAPEVNRKGMTENRGRFRKRDSENARPLSEPLSVRRTPRLIETPSPAQEQNLNRLLDQQRPLNLGPGLR